MDADWAGDREDKYSTNGGYLVLVGPNSWFPLMWVSRKQTACSRSTTESEIVALAHSLFLEALPMMSLWDKLVGPASGRPIKLKIFEDNQAAISIIGDGFSSKLCHISRTHGVNLTSIKDELDKPTVELLKIDTKRQAADIFTKGLEPQKWDPALEMLGMSKVPLLRKKSLPAGGADTPGKALQAIDSSGKASHVSGQNMTAMPAGCDGSLLRGQDDTYCRNPPDKYTAIGDTGAGGAVGSITALEEQGGNPEQIQKLIRPLESQVRFRTASGINIAETGLEIKTQGENPTTMHLLDKCPLAFSIGEEVSKGYTFVWRPTLKPYFAPDKFVRISCPKTRRYEAEYVKRNVPHFAIKLQPARAQPQLASSCV